MKQQIRNQERKAIAAYIEQNPTASTGDIALEFNLSNRTVLYLKADLGIHPKPSRIGLIRARIKESPCTAEIIAEELEVPLKVIQGDLCRLKWQGEVMDERLWRVV